MNNVDVDSHDFFQQMESELELQQQMLKEDDFSKRKFNNDSKQDGYQQQQQIQTHNDYEHINQEQSAPVQVYKPSLRFYDQWENQSNKQEHLIDHYYQNQFANKQPSQNKQDKTYPNNQMMVNNSNSHSIGQMSEQMINKTQGHENHSQRDNKLQQNKETDSKLFSNFFMDSVQGNNNIASNQDEYELQKKNLYFQSVNNQQEALKNILSQIQKKDSPLKSILKSKQQQNQHDRQEFQQDERNYDKPYQYNPKQHQTNGTQSQELNSFLTNQSNQTGNNKLYDSPSSPSKYYPKMSFGQPSNDDHIQLQYSKEFNQDKGENFNLINQKFYQHTQTLQEQIKEILSQKNKKQKAVDSSEDIQTIDEQSRESSLDLTNRNSLLNLSERPQYIKGGFQQYEDTIQTTTGRMSTQNDKKNSKKPSRNNSLHGKKKELKKDQLEKNTLQIQYERALDLKYNHGMKKKQQPSKLIEEIIPAQHQNENDPLSPKHIFLKLSPRAKNNQNITLQTINNAFSSGNSVSNVSQKDELANFKKQINNLISKENEIKGFFSGSNTTTPTNVTMNVNSESTANDYYQTNILKIQVHNTEGSLLQQQMIQNKYTTHEYDTVKEESQQSLTERIPSTNRQLNSTDRFKENKQQKNKEEGNLFDKLMKQNITSNKNAPNTKQQPLKRSASAKQVAAKADLNELSPKNMSGKIQKQITSNKNSTNSNSANQQLSSTIPKKPCLKSNSQTKLQINQFNNQPDQNEADQPLHISELQARSSPKQSLTETQKININPLIPSGYNNMLYSQSQIQFGKQGIRSMHTQLGTPNSTNLSMYQNIQNTSSIMSLRQQIENKILRNKDSISTPTLASFSAGPSHQDIHDNNLNNSHYNAKKVVAFHHQILNSDKPKQEILEESSKIVIKQNESITQRGRFPLPLPPQRNSQQNQLPPPQRQSMDKRSSSLPKASYESLVQSALMRQQVFKNPDQQNNTEDDKSQESSNNQQKNNLTSQRDKSPNAQTSSRNTTSRGPDGIGIPQSVERKKRTDSLQVRNTSSSSKQEQSANNKNKQQGLLRQSSERTIKVTTNSSLGNNNSTSLSNSLFYKPSINAQGLIVSHINNNITDSQFSQVRVNNSSLKIKSHSQLDHQDNDSKSLLEMDIIERNNAWLTQRKIKNEQRKVEQDQKEIEGCTFKPKLRSKSPMNNNLEREETHSSYSQQNLGYNQSEYNIQQLKQQQSDLYSSYFNKSSITRATGGGGTKTVSDGYSMQHQLNLLRKSSLNSVGQQQKVKSIFPQNFFVNQQYY